MRPTTDHVQILKGINGFGPQNEPSRFTGFQGSGARGPGRDDPDTLLIWMISDWRIVVDW